MIAPASFWYRVLDPVADSVNPSLTIAALIAAFLEWRANGKLRGLLFTLATALGIAGIYAIRAADHALQIWQRHGGDYSSHTAYATSLAASLLIWRKTWRPALLAVWLGYLALIVVIGYHTLADVITAALVAVAVTLPWHVLTAIRSAQQRPLSGRGS